ncbi:histidine kinase [Stenotrophomonas sp. HITSZ_GD]|uniref:sensor histidine kinase n=1 Tax=Stenotrophomonas sp. HITSZ_GD TaxID=3037248 RepID=UPI00240D4133|nr:histidine kinase [Stenotrophomonas sp. HITSZ_GD]MDG2527049.1 histidine kinase [Stenotrophomonas sp. HITSZ_GD]
MLPALTLCALSFLGERIASLLWVRQDDVGVSSVASPLLLAWLLTRPHRQSIAAVVGTMFGLWLAMPPMPGVPWQATALLAAWLPLPAAGLAWLARRGGAIEWPPREVAPTLRLLLCVGVALPALDLCWMLAWAQGANLTYSRVDMLHLLLTHAAGYLLLPPIVMALASPRGDMPARQLSRDLAIAALLAAPPLWLWSPLSDVVLPSALMTIFAAPLLLWVLLHFGLGGACVALWTCGTVGLAYSQRGAGPFRALPPPSALLGMQAWLCAIAGALWLISMMVEQQRSVARCLCEAYRQLSELAGRVLVVQEEERTRIARDLHDDINQSLAALSIRLSYLKRSVDESQRDAVAELQQELMKVSNDIRSMSHGLHPAMLRFTGLASALTAFCQGHGQRSTVRVHCDVVPPDGLGDARELSLFRIVQEALNNVEKHAHAHEAWVRLGMQGEDCVLSVSDDGIGPPCRRRQVPTGLGLISMSERARLLGGQLTVAARDGGGTQLEVRFPFAEAASVEMPS